MNSSMGVWSWMLSTLLLSAYIFSMVSMNHLSSAINQNVQPDKCNHHCNNMVWNVQGAGSREVLNVLREHIHIYIDPVSWRWLKLAFREHEPSQFATR